MYSVKKDYHWLPSVLIIGEKLCKCKIKVKYTAGGKINAACCSIF